MPTWAPITSNVIDHGFGASRGGAPVTGFVVHHVAGYNARDYVANQNERNSHPTYHIDRHGKVTGIVHPDRRPFSSGSIDVNAVTVEIDNVAGDPDWPVSRAALRSLEQLIAHHAVESPREDFAVYNTPGKSQSGFWVAPHSQTASNGTECPGNFVRANLDDVIANANDLIEGEDMPSAEEIARAVWTYESRKNGAKFGDMLRVAYQAVKFGAKGVRTHGDLTGAIMSEIGAQKIFRAKNGTTDPLNVQELAETLAPLLSETEAKELADAVVKRAAEVMTKGVEDE